MRRFVELAALATVVVLAMFTLASADTIDRNPAGPIKQISDPPPDLVDPPELPEPVEPPNAPNATPYDGFQLVGFTSERFLGNRGILNLSRACSSIFGHSRACTAREIMDSVQVPEVPRMLRMTHAWVQSNGAEMLTGFGNGVVTDCQGWASSLGRDFGLAIELGTPLGCYGGFMPQSCDQELVVACCAIVE